MHAQDIMQKKRKLWIKLYPENWIHGSTREEMTNAERAVWIDLLALAALNDPPGRISFRKLIRLAKQINVSAKLLKCTLKKALQYDKIETNPSQIKNSILEDIGNSKQTSDQSCTYCRR